MAPTPKLTLRPATRQAIKGRISLEGPPGSGKTFTALTIGQELAAGGLLVVIDTENQSSKRFARDFTFSIIELPPPYDPRIYIDAIHLAEEAGAACIIVDSASHAWAGEGGVLDIQSDVVARKKTNSFDAWREATPIQNEFIGALLHCKTHLIVTLRSKMAYEVVTNEQGKKVPKKLGLQPIQRDGFSYEFDLVAELDNDHTLVVTKARGFHELDGAVIKRPGADLGKRIAAWLADGEAPTPEPPRQSVATTTAPAKSDVDWASKIQRGLESVRKHEMTDAQQDTATDLGLRLDAGEASESLYGEVVALYRAVHGNGATHPLPRRPAPHNGHAAPEIDPLADQRMAVIGALTRAFEAGVDGAELPTPAVIGAARSGDELAGLMAQIEKASGA